MHSRIPILDSNSSTRSEFVLELRPGAHVHIIGISGTGTTAVCSLLKQLGYRVTGSDKAYYPPMGDVVRDLADDVYEGYNQEHLFCKPELVVIGNSVGPTNPEVTYVLENKLPYASMPEVFAALLVGKRQHCAKSVVVVGTHGKTTTTALISTMLDRAGLKPGFFIGGVVKCLPTSIRPVDLSMPLEKRIVVLEGDEYDSAFFAKWPKFHSYRPDIVVVTSLEFDHADIYQSVEEIELEFTRLVERVPVEGLILVCSETQRLLNLSQSWRSSDSIGARVVLYGEKQESEFRLIERASAGQEISSGSKLSLLLDGVGVELCSKLGGRYNALNLLAGAAVGKSLGLSRSEIIAGLEAFSGVSRRQDIVACVRDIVIMEDFAHHPTAVRAVLEGIKESYPQRRLVAVFEPRSNTSRKAYFQDAYGESFMAADVAVLANVKNSSGYNNTDSLVGKLDVECVVESISRHGTNALFFSEPVDIKEFLLTELRSGDIVVVMSNGDFGGLLSSLVNELKGLCP